MGNTRNVIWTGVLLVFGYFFLGGAVYYVGTLICAMVPGFQTSCGYFGTIGVKVLLRIASGLTIIPIVNGAGHLIQNWRRPKR